MIQKEENNSIQTDEVKVVFESPAPPPNHKLALWYRTPAIDWEREAIPIGNGYMGGMIFGGIHQERIQYNEKTLWTGGPRENAEYDGGNRPDALSHIESIRNKLRAGDKVGATEEAKCLTGIEKGFGAYQSFGNVYLNFNHPKEVTVHNYRRELDLEDGIARVSYSIDETNYKREYFCSYPDRVMVMRMTSSQFYALNFDIMVTSDQQSINTISKNQIITRGTVVSNGMICESQLMVINNGGKISVAYDVPKGEQVIRIKNADEVTIIMTAGTDYENVYPTYTGEDPNKRLAEIINVAASKSFEELEKNHKEDYCKLFNRVCLDLDQKESILPTDERRSSYKQTLDRNLEVLMYQYGRYLLIASSREGSLPANLQGVWNVSNKPAWCCDYHYNINIQMNYWPATTANLSECLLPLVDYTETLRIPGRITAEKHFGVTGGGWVVNTMNNPFGFTAPGWEFKWGWAPNSNAFICQNLWEYYQFTNDAEYLKEHIYPIMKEAAEFWSKWLIEDRDGTLVSTPSYSPEHGDIEIGCAMDQQLAYDLFTNVTQASEILQIDEAFREVLIDKKARLSPPVQVGRWGQLQEWKEDIDDEKDTHRHISQAVALFPCSIINRNTPKWLEATKTTLVGRGDESTGWSRAWKINLWARLMDGNHAYEILQGQLDACTHPNLFDFHPPFQIDGNFGFVSGVCEMLLQSHTNVIDLLPALPDAWAKGSVSGLCARGAFEVDIKWEDKKPIEVFVTSHKGNICKIRSSQWDIMGCYHIVRQSDNQSIDFDIEKGNIAFNTVPGECYQVAYSE